MSLCRTLTWTTCPSSFTVTPLGTGMGTFPIRLNLACTANAVLFTGLGAPVLNAIAWPLKLVLVSDIV